jgi:predicted nuclease of predicted toxin-antitoxin system
LKLKLDENLPGDLAIFLRGQGHDVVDVVQEEMAGEDDQQVIKAAAHEGRILMTFDLDFADIRHYPPGTHSGIVVFRLHDERWKILEEPARRLIAEGGLDKLEQGLAIVDETRVRYRRSRRRDRP